ncbi:MAG: methyl-accepting chemotaxis protein [Treponema sp.]|jgi:methyl-accepting chemotaxis protein|nr:methyl-accepting chemotaxis protein [Treponema sp.]
MKIRTKLTAINVFVTVALITLITVVILNRSAALQQEAALENLENMSASIANEIALESGACVYMLNATAVISCYDEAVPLEMRRGVLQKNLAILVAGMPEFIAAYAVWPPNAFDGADALYAGTPGATESGQLSFLVTKASGALEFKTCDRPQDVLATIHGPGMILTTPTLSMVNGVQKFTINIGIPFALGENQPGFLAFQVGLDGTQAITEKINPYGSGRLAVYNNEGVIAGHYDAGRVGADFREADAGILGPEGIAAVEASLNSGEGRALTYRGSAIAVYPFVTLGSPAWVMVSFVPLDAVLAPVNTMIRFSIIFVAVAGIVAALIISFIAGRFARRIVRVGEAVRTIAKGDFTRQITVRAHDEIGAMEADFNETLQKVSGMILNIKEHAARLSKIGAELSVNMSNTAPHVEGINSATGSVKQQVSNQAEKITQTISTMHAIIASIEELNQHIETQAQSINQSSAAIEQMLANIASVTQTLVQNDNNVKNLAAASDTGRAGLQEVSTDIQEIARESEGLLEITAVMDNIASQTNLLSMNAAIEAAHAGETGKGFAVVADEIRKLAESSGEQSKTISTVLKKIKDSIDRISRSTDGVINRFEAINQNVKTVSEQEANIRSSMEEQGMGSKQILEYISQLNEITRTIKDDCEHMRARSGDVIEESRNLEHLTEEISLNMNGMSDRADRISAAVQRVDDLSGENKRHIDVLSGEIHKFKTGKE